MNRVSLKAFLLGNICDVLATILFGSLLVFYSHTKVHQPGMTSQQVRAAAIALRSHGLLRLATYANGFLASLLAGFVGGRVAGRHEPLNGALSSFFCCCLGVLVMATSKSRDPLPLQCLMLCSAVACAALGGFLAQRRA